jgi:inner membrane transporter RhtA
MLYLTLGHGSPTSDRATAPGGVESTLGAAMLIAAIVTTPLGLAAAAAAFTHPGWLLAGVAVGVCSSVVPYVTDQPAMARLHQRHSR